MALRGALGSVKDNVSLRIAKAKKKHVELKRAVIKATTHRHCPPKEKHVLTVVAATRPDRPPSDQVHLAHALSKRLSKTDDWRVALKTLILIHRITREGNQCFTMELKESLHHNNVFRDMSNFMDDSNSHAIECSWWIRSYSSCLGEKLKMDMPFRFDVLCMGSEQLLEDLKSLQLLLDRLLDCVPKPRDVLIDILVQNALELIVKDSFHVYSAIGHGISELSDSMLKVLTREEAESTFNIYMKSLEQTDKLAKFYIVCREIFEGTHIQLQIFMKPPHSFLEGYVKAFVKSEHAMPVTVE